MTRSAVFRHAMFLVAPASPPFFLWCMFQPACVCSALPTSEGRPRCGSFFLVDQLRIAHIFRVVVCAAEIFRQQAIFVAYEWCDCKYVLPWHKTLISKQRCSDSDICCTFFLNIFLSFDDVRLVSEIVSDSVRVFVNVSDDVPIVVRRCSMVF